MFYFTCNHGLTNDMIAWDNQARFALHTLKLLATPWRSSATILTLFNVFEIITIDNSLFALTTSTEYDIHIHIHIHIFVYKTLTKRNEIPCESRNYDKENASNKSSLCVFVQHSDEKQWVIDMGGFSS